MERLNKACEQINSLKNELEVRLKIGHDNSTRYWLSLNLLFFFKAKIKKFETLKKKF